jgi:xanthine dehydrogenase YagR molybdenum-binding subunit
MNVGEGIRRVEGPAKVTGRAKYAADNTPRNVLYGVLVGSPVAAGRIRGIDAAAALRIPGVVRVLTRADMPKFGEVTLPAAINRLPMQTDVIEIEGEAVAMVLGETLEAAEAGAQVVKVDAAAEPPLVPGHGRRMPAPEGPFGPDLQKGDLMGELARAKTRLTATYSQTARHHNPMETSATVAEWRNGKLQLWDAVQHAENVLIVLPAALGIKREDIRVIAPHTGGGFGSKGYVWPHQILTAAAARIVGRPVKLQLTRAQMYAMAGHQPIMRQELSLGCDAAGKLTALQHKNLNACPVTDTFFEPATSISRSLYAAPAIWTSEEIERVNISLGTPMRAPAEGPGSWALESAMDELAEQAGMDPLDLRIAAHADVHPENGKPWSSKKLLEAYEEGARLYGWRERAARPRIDGPWRIGHGMATCTMGNFRFPGEARVRLTPEGGAVVETNTHDIGTGTQTIFSQIAAEELGLPVERVSIRWGDSELPKAGPVYGSSATMGTGGAVALAARDAKAKLARLTGAAVGELDVSAALRRINAGVVGEGRFTLPGDGDFNLDGTDTPHAMKTWGAIFLEVGVDPDFGIARLRRAVGVYSAGRIINPRTARSQMTGGIIWGWGMATMEGTEFEPAHGRWLAKNLSNIMVPVNADIPADITIRFTDEFDPHASPIGARGIGELAATGIAAAAGAAVRDAVGVRVRDLPITPAKVLKALETATA